MTTTESRVGLGVGLGSDAERGRYESPTANTQQTRKKTMRHSDSSIDVVVVVERRLAAEMKSGLNRKEAYLEIQRSTPELIRRFRKLATAQQLRDLETGRSELAGLKQKLIESQQRIAELEAELAALKGVPAAA